MKALVTGAAGFIGMHVARRLLERGDEVTGIDNLNDYYDPRLKEARLETLAPHPGFGFRRVDVADAPVIARLFAERWFERVVHLAAQAGVRYSLTRPDVYVESNLVGFANILEACRRHAVGISSMPAVRASMAPIRACRSRCATKSTTPSASTPRPRRRTS